MPYRHALTMLEHAWRWLVVMYEPAIAYAIAAAAAVTAAGAGSDSHWLAGVDLLALSGLVVGSVIDIAARGRVYGSMPPEQRKSRYREWKERLLWAAIGFGTGAALSTGVNGTLAVMVPAIASSWVPFINLVCVGVIALPLIDGFRGVMRLAAGQSTQQAMAGLVVGWLFRRAGQTPPVTPPPSPRQGGQGDA